MTKLILARHGESEANVQQVFSNRRGKHGLTALGRSQAGRLAHALSQMKAESLICSPLDRAIQTAEIVGTRLSLKASVVDELIEFDVGEFEGKSDSASWDAYTHLTSDWSAGRALSVGLGGGESPVEMATRLQQVFERFVGVPGCHIAITHGGLLRIALPLLLADLEPGFFANRHLEPANYAVLTHQDGEWRLTDWNIQSPQ